MTQVSPDMVEVAARGLAEFDIRDKMTRRGEVRDDAFIEKCVEAHWREYVINAYTVLTAALGDKYVIVEKDISDARLNILLGRAVDAPVTPMRAMLRDFYRIAIAVPTPEQQP